MSNKGFKSAVRPRLAVVVGSLAGVHSDVVLETAAAAIFDIGLQSLAVTTESKTPDSEYAWENYGTGRGCHKIKYHAVGLLSRSARFICSPYFTMRCPCSSAVAVTTWVFSTYSTTFWATPAYNAKRDDQLTTVTSVRNKGWVSMGQTPQKYEGPVQSCNM